MAQVSERDVLNALSKVNDPDLNRDLVSLNMVKDLKVDGGQVSVKIELTTPACPLKAKIQNDVETAIKAVPGVSGVQVTMGATVRGAAKQKEDLLPQVKNVVLVGAGKGGVGKSTCAVNLAVALKNEGAAVGLLDADFYGPSMPIMLGIKERPVSKDGKTLEPIVAHGLKAMSIGLLVDPDQALIWRGPMLHGALIQLFRDVNWGALDYLIVDLPPGTGDVPLSISQQIRAAGAVLVTTPQDVSLADVMKAKLMFDKVNIPVLGMVENMSNFICPHCHQATPIFDVGGGRRASEAMGIPFLGEIPLDLVVRQGGDKGVPIVVGMPDSPQSKAFQDMARNIAGQVSKQAMQVKLPVFGQS
ncbi:MAG TPA: Mrp/NBP35 family ATP-binding protein [Myxococcales bacterium]|jgi:ATP-binding protein involved in chromosome partitioning